jgi:DNA helicase-2/ATP-dependent DNA helicase PcrA
MSAMWESLAAEDELKIEPGERRRFLGAFHEHRWRYGYTLLAELPDLLRRALEEHSDLDGLDYAVLIIDEYQDLNACDLRLFRLLAQRGVSVIAIGDDDQSIYSFRKAAPQGIRRFLDEYQTDCDYPLTVCHRSPRKVIEWSQRVMAGDPHRLPRPALTTRNEAPDGDVALPRFAGGQSEAKGVARLIKWLQSQSVPLADILVLTRTDHNQVFSRPIREALTAVGIESTDPNAVDDLLAGRTNRQLIAHLRLLEHREDSLAWATLLKLRPQIGPSFFDFIYGRARERGTTFGQAFLAAAEDEFDGGPKGSSDRALDLVTEVITRLDGCQLPDEGDDVAWAQWIAERASDGNLPPVTDELRFLMEGVEGLIDDAPQLGRFVSQLAPLGADLERAESDCVRFMTLTGSKGLTVRATIIVGVEHDLIPRPGEDMQEERRLLFVAMTRPTEYLYLTYAGMRRGQQQRAGRGSTGRRNPSVLLQDGGVERQDGESFLKSIGA